jgi:glycosyltransferase involved in cell wall biosynthesis
MKILFICKTMNMGGLEKNLVLLSRELIKLNHEVVVAAAPGILKIDLINQGVKFVDFKMSFNSVSSIFSDVKQLGICIKEHRPDIVHSFSASSTLIYNISKVFSWFKINTKFPTLISSVMGLQESPNEAKYITYLKVYLTVLGAKKNIVISPQIKMALEKLFISSNKLVERKIVGVEPHYGYDKKSYKADKSVYGISTPFVVTTIGALSSRKSHDLFIDAARITLSKRNDVSFLIIGEGPDKDKLLQKISTSGLDDNVKLAGVTKDLPAVFSLTDICVKPGVVEGFIGVTVLEAQVTGTPVVAFDTEDVKLGIENGVTGLIAQNADVTDLSKKLNLLLDDAQFRLKLGLQGQMFAREHWSVDGITKNLIGLYEAELKEQEVENAPTKN